MNSILWPKREKGVLWMFGSLTRRNVLGFNIKFLLWRIKTLILPLQQHNQNNVCSSQHQREEHSICTSPLRFNFVAMERIRYNFSLLLAAEREGQTWWISLLLKPEITSTFNPEPFQYMTHLSRWDRDNRHNQVFYRAAQMLHHSKDVNQPNRTALMIISLKVRCWY